MELYESADPSFPRLNLGELADIRIQRAIWEFPYRDWLALTYIRHCLPRRSSRTNVSIYKAGTGRKLHSMYRVHQFDSLCYFFRRAIIYASVLCCEFHNSVWLFDNLHKYYIISLIKVKWFYSFFMKSSYMLYLEPSVSLTISRIFSIFSREKFSLLFQPIR